MKFVRSLLLAGSGLLMSTALQAELSDGELRIAVMTDMQGVYSELAGQGALIAAEMALDDHGGRVLGRPVRLISVDHRLDPEYAVARARQLVEEQGVDAIVELMGSEVALAVQGYAREQGVVTLVSGAATPQLTQHGCSRTGVHWAADSFALTRGGGQALIEQGVDSWYFVTVDYPLAIQLERATTSVLESIGGKVLGSARHPFRGTDFSRQLLEAQASGAGAIALLNAGEDTYRSIRQAYELGIMHAGQVLSPGLLFITDIRALGLYVTSGLQMTTPFYWNQSEAAREWADRFRARHGARPTSVQAATYSSVAHYLKAVEAVGSDDGVRVVAKMQELPVNDFYANGGYIRPDGRLVHDLHLVRVKRPSESREAWDYFHVLEPVAGEGAFLPLELSSCGHIVAARGG